MNQVPKIGVADLIAELPASVYLARDIYRSVIMLAFEQFQQLLRAEQGEYITHRGTYLALRWQDNYAIDLYWLGTFFCEVWLEQDCLELERFRPFTDAGSLEAYLPFLSLPTT